MFSVYKQITGGDMMLVSKHTLLTQAQSAAQAVFTAGNSAAIEIETVGGDRIIEVFEIAQAV